MKFILLSGSMVVAAMAGLMTSGCGQPAGVSKTSGSLAVPSSAAPDGAATFLEGRRQQLVGVKVLPVVRGTLALPVRAPGVVTYDGTRLTDVNLRLDGWVRELFVNVVGQRVVKGEPLFSLYSQELQGAQLQYLAAVRSLEQLTPAQLADRDYQERLIQTPRQRLLNWDVPADQLGLLQKSGAALEAVVFRAPADGVVIEQAVIKGMHVAAGQTLYKMADTSSLWVEADFSAADAGQLRDGEPATVSVDSMPEGLLTGRILNQYPTLSAQTSTAKVRIAVPNAHGRLRPGMLVAVEVMTEPRAGLLVPTDAVIDSGRRQTVFVAEGNGYFQPRSVVIGARGEDRSLVVSGLKEGEQVVTRAAFFVDSESQLRPALDSYGGQLGRPGPSTVSSRMTLRFGTDANSPRAAKTAVHVQLLDATGAPVTDATVHVRFTMPPMPAMNMPAMQANTRLAHSDGGVYRGTIALPMAGRWEATVSAYRGGVQAATQQTSIVAR
jgi:membrane fusion protein, copper/silver efflux system